MTASIRSVYREMIRQMRLLPEQQQNFIELQQSFKRPLASGESSMSRLKEAESRLSFWRMTTPKKKSGRAGVWVYKDGQRPQSEGGTLRDAKGKVVSNWDGNNLDPEAVKRHNQQLRRAGFVNNAHAKGFF